MFVIVLACFIAMSPAGKVAAADAPQTTVTPPSKTEIGSPAVVIYTLSTCPHCAEAKAYLTKEGIPFTNREVDTDDEHMAELVEIYDDMKVPDEKRGVPLFIIGGKTRLQGFDREKIKAALKEAARN
jgi:glutaredoxin